MLVLLEVLVILGCLRGAADVWVGRLLTTVVECILVFLSSFLRHKLLLGLGQKILGGSLIVFILVHKVVFLRFKFILLMCTFRTIHNHIMVDALELFLHFTVRLDLDLAGSWNFLVFKCI